MTGFLEENEGVRSMTRLCAAVMMGAMVILVLALAVYLLAARWLTGEKPDAGVITAFAAPLVPLAGGVWGALHERNGSA